MNYRKLTLLMTAVTALAVICLRESERKKKYECSETGKNDGVKVVLEILDKIKIRIHSDFDSDHHSDIMHSGISFPYR